MEPTVPLIIRLKSCGLPFVSDAIGSNGANMIWAGSGASRARLKLHLVQQFGSLDIIECCRRTFRFVRDTRFRFRMNAIQPESYAAATF